MQELQNTAKELRRTHLQTQQSAGIDLIPTGDFSFYDNMLDTAVLLNAVLERYAALKLPALDEYFAMARGYQGNNGDVKALAMKKWFNTNYHYMVPEISHDTEIKLNGTKPFDEFAEAKSLGINAKPVVIGAFTFLRLARYTDGNSAYDFADKTASAYCEYLRRFGELGAEWVESCYRPYRGGHRAFQGAVREDTFRKGRRKGAFTDLFRRHHGLLFRRMQA